MGRITYTRKLCEYCEKEISTSGGGVSHYRIHVREGLLREIKADYRTKYPRVKFERISQKDGSEA